MSKIKLNLTSPFTGQQISFIAPCNSVDTECLVIGGIEYTVVDADGVNVTGVSNVWNSGALISVILNVDSHTAFIQNANTNTYIEATMVKKTDVVAEPGDVGLVKLYTDTTYGLGIKNGCLAITGATENLIKGKGSSNAPITPKTLDYAMIRGLAYNEKDMTDTEKASALAWLGSLGRCTIGSYVGANSSPKVLTFDGKPLIVFISCTDSGLGTANAGVMVRGQSSVITYKRQATNDIGMADLNWEDNTLTISNVSSVSVREHCLNASQKNYTWIAILED